MKTVDVKLTWYESPGDGDCHSVDVEITDEKHALLRKYFRTNKCDDIHSECIKDLTIKTIVKEVEDWCLDGFKEDSCHDGYEDYVSETKEEGEEPEEFDEWYDRFTVSAELIWEEPEKHSFTINISNGGESEMTFNVYEDELELINQADEEFEDYENVEGLEDFYKEIMDAARTQLEEDLDLTGDDPSILEELDWSVTLND